MKVNACAVAALAGTLCAAPALASGLSAPSVIFSEISFSPTSAVPGLGGALFDSFDRLYLSPDGSRYIITASSDLDTSIDEVLLVGDTASGSASLFVQEGVTDLGDGELVGFINRRAGINDAGQFVFATNTNGDSSSDEVIVTGDLNSGALSVVAREGNPIPGPLGSANNFGSTLDLGGIAQNGDVSFRAPFTVGALPTDQDDFLILNGAVLAQEGVTAPGNQAGGASETWDAFDTEDFRTDATGNNWLAQGDLSGDTSSDDVLVVNGDVVLQEGSPIINNRVNGPIDSIVEASMDSAGNWLARGDVDSGEDFLVFNGDIFAATGDAVPGSSGESYSDAVFSATFFSMISNNNGDVVFGATTDNPDDGADAVLVFNNELVIARQGDGVDLDGNGLLDDNVFIDVFNNDDAVLTDGLQYIFTATLVDSEGIGLGQALITITIPAPGAASLLAAAGLAATRRRRA